MRNVHVNQEQVHITNQIMAKSGYISSKSKHITTGKMMDILEFKG